MIVGLLPLIVLPKQMVHPFYDPALIKWVCTAESSSGFCVVKDEEGKIFYHLSSNTGNILFPVNAKGLINSEGTIADPTRLIALFEGMVRQLEQ